MKGTIEAEDGAGSAAHEAQDVLRRQLAELENQIAHLERSNTEMKEILDTDGPDPDLRAAIGENIVAIARRKAILEDLRKQFPDPAAVESEQPGISL